MSRARCAVEAVLLEYLLNKGLSSSQALAVAYSGGPDSTALLAALTALDYKRPVAVYVDHGLRPRAELDAEFATVRAVSSSLGARLFVAHLRPGAVLQKAEARGASIEAEARLYRYAVFKRALARTGALGLLLAHTRDDQIETLLMRLFGGAGTTGLRGIPDSSGAILRPFLGTDKSELLSYLRTRQIPYSTDSTNASEHFLRNAVRGSLVPALDAVFSGWRAGLALTSAKAERDEEALAAAAEALAFAPCGEGELGAPAEALLGAPDALASRSIVRAAGKLLGVERFPSALALAALHALRGGGARLYRGAGLELRIKDDRAVLRRSAAFPRRGGLDFPRHGGYFVLIDRPRRVRVGSLEVRAAWCLGGRPGIRADAFRFPLVVRSRRPGDAIAQKNGTKRLDALFSEWSLEESARAATPVVEDRDGIVAVLGAAFGGKDRYRESPRGESASDSPTQGASPNAELARRFSIIVKGA